MISVYRYSPFEDKFALKASLYPTLKDLPEAMPTLKDLPEAMPVLEYLSGLMLALQHLSQRQCQH